MGRIRRGGYIFEWWTGDHPPRHVHVSDANGELLGRVTVTDKRPLDAWIPPKKVVEIISQLEKEGRL
jgi:hypothetical protein